MSGILGLLADAEKLTPDQRTQSVKDGVLPPELAGMINSFTKQEVNQTKPEPSNGSSISDQVMSKADEVLDPRQEILEKINNLKDDIGKIQGAIQEGEVKPYVGIPLLEKKFGELQKLQSMIQPPPQQQPQQPQAAQMPQGLNAQQPNQQPPSEGLNALQSNLPQQMAHGGIVNLASGDLIDDDDDDEDEQRAFESQMANMPMGEGLGSAIMARADTKKPSMSSFTEGIKSLGKKPAENIEKEPSRPTPKTAKEFYRNMYGDIKKVAEKMGISNPDTIAHLGASQSAIETGYGKHAPNNNFFGIKGAGSKQTTQEYIPGKGMVTIQDSFRGYESPQESIKDYIDFLQNNPRYKSVLEAKTVPDAIKAQSLTGYATDPKYSSKLNSIYASNMAEGGIVNLAHGGKIKHFDGRDGSDVYDPMGGGLMYGSTTTTPEPLGSRNLYKMVNPSYITPEEVNLEWEKKYGKKKFNLTPDLQAQEDAYKKADYFKRNNPSTSNADTEDAELGQAMRDLQNSKVDETKQPEAKKSHMDSFMDYMNQSREDLKKSHETDKYMGLLMAGLGMMGGTSQFAGANIGKGAAQGVQHFADLQKQQAAEKANLDKLDLYGRRAQETSDLYRSMRQTPEERAYALQEQLDVKRNAQRGLDEERLNKRLSGRQTQIENNVRNLLKMGTIDNITDPDMINKYNSAVSRALANDAPYNSLYKQVYGTDYNIPNMAEIAGLPKIKEINGKTYVLQENNKYKEK